MNIKDFIDQHDHINYCEAIIAPDGNIEYAYPSHEQYLITKSNKTIDQLKKIIPFYANYMHWLLGYTGCICVWYDRLLSPINYTTAQVNTIRQLIKQNIITKYPTFEITNEFEYYTINKKAEDATEQLIRLQNIKDFNKKSLLERVYS